MPNMCEKLSDEWWVMKIEWWKLSDEKWLAKQALNVYVALTHEDYYFFIEKNY